jgi:hypothetical protein
MLFNKKGQKGGLDVTYLVYVIIAVVGMAIPITLDVIAEQNFTGILGTIMPYVAVFLGLAVIVIIAKSTKMRN